MTSSISCMPIKSEKITDVLPFLGDFGCIFKRKTKQTVQQSTLCICKSWLVQLELQDLSNLCQIPGQSKYTETGARTATQQALNYCKI